jgi:hypothetical protein
MKNLFIQSFMDSNGETFLEVGSTKQQDIDNGVFTSVPSSFNVVSNGTCFIEITKVDFNKLKSDWGVSETQIQIALRNQWLRNGSNNSIIFDVK